MPQMAPIMWILIFVSVFFVFMLIMNMVYFFFMAKLNLFSKTSLSFNLNQTKNWKW